MFNNSSVQQFMSVIRDKQKEPRFQNKKNPDTSKMSAVM